MDSTPFPAEEAEAYINAADEGRNLNSTWVEDYLGLRVNQPLPGCLKCSLLVPLDTD